jgi:hypothetical protein
MSVASESIAIDISGAKAPIVLVPESDPTPAAVPDTNPPQTVALPVAAPQTLTKELTDAVDGIVHDLSGLTVSGLSVGDLIRFVPRMASLVHTLQIRGSEKRALVMAAFHILVDRVIPEADRHTAHALVDVVFPPAIAAVIDVAAGRVTFGQTTVSAATTVAVTGASNQVVVAEATNCLSLLFGACAKKI